MIDTRAVGQELQDQVLDAARKGRERVSSTVKAVAKTAQQIRPQLANLPKPNLTIPNLTIPTLPTPAQLAEMAPALAARLPSPHQLMSGAQELAGHARSVQRLVVEQVRTVAVPLAHEAAARLAKISAPQSQTATHVSRVHVSSAVPARDSTAKNGTTKDSTATDSTATDSTAKDSTAKDSMAKDSMTRAEHATNGQHKAKPKAKLTTK
jgi:hypothetical protein